MFKTIGTVWGLLGVVCVGTVLFTLLWESSSRTQTAVETLDNRAMDVTLHNVQEPKITVVKEPKTRPLADKKLNRIIEDWARNTAGDEAVVVREIDGQQRYAQYREDNRFITASTYKLFLSYVILEQIQQGKLDFDTSTSLGLTLDECFESLLIYSADKCAYPMGSLVGWDTVDKTIQKAGFSRTTINNYDSHGNFTGDKYTEPRDEADFMYRLASGELLNERMSRYLITKLTEQVWKERIPAGVPDGVQVASKPGWVYDYENSAAIVYGPQSTYVMVVMTNNSTVDDIANISEVVYAYLQEE